MPAATDWSALARARGLVIPAEEISRVAEPLERLDAVFRPLSLGIPPGTQPAIIFRAGPEPAE